METLWGNVERRKMRWRQGGLSGQATEPTSIEIPGDLNELPVVLKQGIARYQFLKNAADMISSPAATYRIGGQAAPGPGDLPPSRAE